MKLSKLKLKNYVHFEEFELVFNDDITHLIAMNGEGKTTIGLTAIWAGFKGIAEKGKDVLIGERYRFISPGKKSLDIEITLHDEVKGIDILLKRHITKDVNQISIECPCNDSPFSKGYIENLLNITFLSASHFTSLSGKEQALALGIDTNEYDIKIKESKIVAQLLRKQIKSIGDLPELEKVEMVSLTVINSKRDTLVAENKIQTDLEKDISDQRDEIIKAELMVTAAQQKVNELEDELSEFEIPTGMLNDIDYLDEQIVNAEETNALAVVYEANCTKQLEKEGFEKKLESNKSDEEIIQIERLTYIKDSSLGMKGLSVDATGSLLMNDKPIKPPYFSKGELEMIVANIASGLHPEFKTRFIDDFDLLDDENQKKIIKGLTKRGFQIVTASVGNKKTSDKAVLLRQCKIVE